MHTQITIGVYRCLVHDNLIMLFMVNNIYAFETTRDRIFKISFDRFIFKLADSSSFYYSTPVLLRRVCEN